MGLSMYLEKDIYIGAHWEHRGVTGALDLYARGERIPIRLDRVNKVTEHLVSWRKANAIHGWFVRNVQDTVDDCKRYRVSFDQLQRLLRDVRQVQKDPSLASSLLPIQDGFFFGGNEYDEWYYQKLDFTEKVLQKIIFEDGPRGEYYYQSSW